MAARPDRRRSATNPQLEGNVQLLTYSPGGTRGEAETLTATFNAADAAGLAYCDRRRWPQGATLRVEGLRELKRAFARAPKP